MIFFLKTQGLDSRAVIVHPGGRERKQFPPLRDDLLSEDAGFRLTSTYNNTTDREIDAMAALFLFSLLSG